MKRVLLVEDNSDVRLLLVRVLEDAGYSVETAVTFIRAKDLIVTGQIELLVADLVIPGGGSGADLTRLATAHGVRSVLYTGHPDWADGRKVAPNVPFLFKPFRPSELLHELARLRPPNDGADGDGEAQ
jgi:DNA-binding NtrC family response regulator